MKLRCACGNEVDARGGAVKVTCAQCIMRMMSPPPSSAQPVKVPPEVRTLVVGECGNHVSGAHQGDRPCDVLSGRRCMFFESVVIPGQRRTRGAAAYRSAFIEAAPAVTVTEALDVDRDNPQIVPAIPKRRNHLKAIRARCIDCQEFMADIKTCPFDGEQEPLCDLWPYRFGKNPKLQVARAGQVPAFCLPAGRHGRTPSERQHEGAVIAAQGGKILAAGSGPPDRAADVRKLAAKANPRGPRAAIRAHCVWCCANQPSEVRYCPSADCPLHEYRMGRRNPPPCLPAGRPKPP